jgi:putative glutamine amidotransferase
MQARHARPMIAIHHDSYPANRSVVHPGFFDVVQAVGGLPLLLSTTAREAEIVTCLEQVQGVIVDGAPDLDPYRPHHASALLLRRVMEVRRPLLAIGQGMQQLNLVAGGTLYPPLVDDEPSILSHRQPRHAVLLEPGTRVASCYRLDELWVNNNHGQTIRRVGHGLRIGGLAPDGVVEAIEATDPEWFCIGVQWHPETEDRGAADYRLFESLMGACLGPLHPLAGPLARIAA